MAAHELTSLIQEAQDWERRGYASTARRHYEKALQSLPPTETQRAIDLSRWIGRTHVADGDTEAAADCARLSLEAARLADAPDGVAQALNFLGTLAQQMGDLDEAVRLYREAEEVALRVDAGELVAIVRMNLGVVANVRGDPEAALDHYRSSLRGLKEARRHDMVINALNNLGMALTDLQRWEEAEAVYAEALEVCEFTDNAARQAVVEVNRAEMLVHQRRYADAELACNSAFRLMRVHGDMRALGDMSKLQGIAAREVGDLARAEELFERAARYATERNDSLLAAEVAREQATLYRRARQNQKSLLYLNRAHGWFEQLRAGSELTDIDARIHDLEEAFVEVVRGWGESIEKADDFTQGHSTRVATYACALARVAGLPEQALFWFRLGALLHDVGKVVIPAEILNKAGGLTPHERMLLERYPEVGVELLEEVEFAWDIRPMIRFHRERWAGGGYPTGIAGEEIPLAARILAIADVFDAMSTDRPYRTALPLAECFRKMRHDLKGHFDPVLLDLWEGLWERGELTLQAGDAERGAGGTAVPPHGGAVRALRALWIAPTDHPAQSVVDPAGPAVQVVRSGRLKEALFWLEGQEFDVVVLDLAVEGHTGVTALVELRRCFADVPIVALSDTEDDRMALNAIKEGAQEYLPREALEAGALRHVLLRAVERSRVQEEMVARSLVDPLTGLYNRQGFQLAARRHLELAARTGRGLTLLVADVDRLDAINAAHGRPEGDRALRAVAGFLQEAVRKSDLVARLGEDEFVVLMLRTPSAPDADLPALIERTTAGLAEPFALTLNYGIAACDTTGACTIDELLAEAESGRSAYRERRRDAGHRPPPGSGTVRATG